MAGTERIDGRTEDADTEVVVVGVVERVETKAEAKETIGVTGQTLSYKVSTVDDCY